MFLVIVTTVFVGNGVPSAAVIVNSNESSLFQLRPFNTFNTDISASPLVLYSFVNVTSNDAVPLGSNTRLPFPSSTNVNVTTLSVESYLTPLIVSPLCVSLIVYVYVPASV